ncbi:helix-turn-helix domain-containing protein [Nocardia sp. BSTN01]|uniref:helix-turn-helix domain-containing protein n=1 Tax=Nocardia sp. BSTN01 TaxID=2783665 RepID=UPI00188EAA14|nr:helix-turn-helix domain-containing protein [Nocardia sp. BSTN01]MBF4998063.1 helix-turn-helix domain-containing protein [Nocardia sp. BSTN01]
MDVDTRVVPANERSDYWHESVCDQFVQLLVTPASRNLQGRIHALDFADTHVRRIAGTEHRFQRRELDIRRGGDPEQLNIVFVNRGSTAVEQDGRSVALQAGSFTFYDSGRPFDFRTRGEFDYTIVLLPKHRLDLPETTLRDSTIRPRSALGGVGRVARRLIGSFAVPGREALGPTQAGAIEDALLATVRPLIAVDEPPLDASMLVVTARAHIQQHLGDPDLSPRTVAAACAISPSYLHRLFDTEPLTVAAFIREQRLRTALELLTSPAHRRDSIAEIGAACGIVDPASFSRMFRSRFGVSPRDLRRGASVQHI